MAIAHEADRLFGVQFHPESILTHHGFRLLANFLAIAGISHHSDRVPDLDASVAEQSSVSPERRHDDDQRIVTF
jgi:hypothetical protein